MLDLALSHGPVPVLLYPNRDSDVAASATRDTVFDCQVTLTSDERTRVGAVVAVWQSSVLRTDWPKDESTSPSAEWETFNTIVITIREGDFVLEQGASQSYVFNITLPPSYTLSRVTPFERVAHVLYVFAFAPSPAYSVIPNLRRDLSPANDHNRTDADPAPPERRRSGLIEAIRRLSIASRSSVGSREGRKSVDNGVAVGGKAGEEDPPQLEPPFPQLEEPYIAECHEQIVVTASQDERGQLRDLAERKDLKVAELGRIQLSMHSDIFILGSAFVVCIYLSELNPLATLHAVQMTFTQRLTSADGRTVHNDKYKVFELGKSYFLLDGVRPAEKDLVWRGEHARIIDSAAKAQKKKGKGSAEAMDMPPSDRIHITCGPRLPSWAMGGRPSWASQDPGMSTIGHELDISFFWSVYGLDMDGGKLNPPDQEGAMRLTLFRLRPTINSCSFLPHNVVTPQYKLVAAPVPDVDACMAPYEPGTEPRSFWAKPDSWVEKDGKRQRLRYRYDQQSFDLRRHQVETNGVCACFYADAHPAWEKGYKPAPKIIDGELDLSPFKPVRGGDEEMLAEKKRREEAWFERHGAERKAVPGFLHNLFAECACETWRKSEVDTLGDGAQSKVDAG